MRRLWPQLPRRTPRASWRRGQCDPGQSRAHQREEAEASASRLQEWPRLRAHGEVPERVPCHPPSEEGQPPRGGRKGEGASGSQPRGGVPAEDPDLELFQGGVTRVSAPGPGPAEERSSMKRPPGGPNCRDNEATGIEPGCSAVLGWGLPRDGVRAGQEEAPCLEGRRRASRPLSHKGLLQTARSAPGRQTCPRRALNTQEACSPPHLAEPREGFLGAKPSNRALRASDPRGPDAADLSAILGGQDG